MANEDHPFIADARRKLEIPDSDNFLDAFSRRFKIVDATRRQQDLALFDAAERGRHWKQDAQLDLTKQRLRELDARLRRTGF